MWQAIRSAAEALLENDVALANAILVVSGYMVEVFIYRLVSM